MTDLSDCYCPSYFPARPDWCGSRVSKRTLSTVPAFAQDVQLISPVDAHEKRRSGEVKLVDVRERFEWEEGGVAEGADLIAMRDPQIAAKFDALTGGDKNAPVALICRTGVRSGIVAQALARAGYTNVYSVNGGMIGSSTGPGWKRTGLPVEAVE